MFVCVQLKLAIGHGATSPPSPAPRGFGRRKRAEKTPRAHSPVFAKAAAVGKLCGQPVDERAHVSATASPTPLLYWGGGGGGGTRLSRGSSPHLVVLEGEILGTREGCMAPSECVGVRGGEIGTG